MAFVIRNQTRQQRVINLPGDNSITLMPIGSRDITGPTDCATLRDEEADCSDVKNALHDGSISREDAKGDSPTEPEAAAPEAVHTGHERSRKFGR